MRLKIAKMRLNTRIALEIIVKMQLKIAQMRLKIAKMRLNTRIALEWERSSDNVAFPIVLRQNSWSVEVAHSRVLDGDIGGVTLLGTIADRVPRGYRTLSAMGAKKKCFSNFHHEKHMKQNCGIANHTKLDSVAPVGRLYSNFHCDDIPYLYI